MSELFNPGRNGGRLMRHPPGVSGNPGGRPRVGRPVSSALAELLDTPGGTPKAVAAAYRKARGKSFCAADLQALKLWEKACKASAKGDQITASSVVMDRTEGKLGPDFEINIGQLQKVTEAQALQIPAVMETFRRIREELIERWPDAVAHLDRIAADAGETIDTRALATREEE